MIRTKDHEYGEPNDENTVLSANDFNGNLVVGAQNKSVRTYDGLQRQTIYRVDIQGKLRQLTLGVPNQVIATDNDGNIILMDKSLIKL